MQSNEQSKGASQAPSINLAAAEKEAQTVNREQIIAAALFAKQLQTDLGSIRSAMIGDGLRIPQVDMNKVMPSEIYKTFRPAGVSAGTSHGRQPVLQSVPAVPVQTQQQAPEPIYNVQIPVTQPVGQPLNTATQVDPRLDPNQLELDFNKTTKYEDVVEAIERLEKKIIIISEKIDALSLDKKKLKVEQNENGT